MSQCSNGKHFNRIPLFQRLVQNPWTVDDLPTEKLVVHMPHKETLGGKSIGLDIHIGMSYIVHKGTLAHIGKARNEEGAGIWIDGR